MYQNIVHSALHLVGNITSTTIIVIVIVAMIATEKAHRRLEGHNGPHLNGTRNGHIVERGAVAVAAAGHGAAADVSVLQGIRPEECVPAAAGRADRVGSVGGLRGIIGVSAVEAAAGHATGVAVSVAGPHRQRSATQGSVAPAVLDRFQQFVIIQVLDNAVFSV